VVGGHHDHGLVLEATHGSYALAHVGREWALGLGHVEGPQLGSREAPSPEGGASNVSSLSHNMGTWPALTNVTIHSGDLIVSGSRSRLVIRNCKFIIKGSLIILDGARALIEDSTVYLDVPSSGDKASNITISSSSELRVVSSVLGTTGLLLVLQIEANSSSLVAIDSLIANASIVCYNSSLELTSSTIRGRVELLGSSSLTAYDSTFTSSLALRQSSSAYLSSSFVQHVFLEFYRRTKAIIRGLRHGYVRSWSFLSNATVGTIYIDLSLSNCYVGSWSLNLTQSAVVALELSYIWEASAFACSILKLFNSSVGEVIAHENSALWLGNSSANMMRALDDSYVSLSEADVLAFVIEDDPEVFVANSSIMSLLAVGRPLLEVRNSFLDDICLACSRDARLGFINCIIAERMTIKARSLVTALGCSIGEVDAFGHSIAKLLDCYTTTLLAREYARIEVWWSLKVCVSLDGVPLEGAKITVFYKNGTEFLSHTTGRLGCSFFLLLCTIILHYGTLQVQPYFVLVEYGLLWASEEVELDGPTVLPIRLERGAELTIRCVDAASKPLRGAHIVIYREGVEFDKGLTGPEGVAIIEDLPVGNYTISVFWCGVEVAREEVFIHGVDDELVIVCSVFDILVFVEGPGGPISNALVSLAMFKHPRIHFTALTNATGVAMLRDIPAGQYDLFVQAEGYVTYEATIEVKEQEQVVKVVLEAVEGQGQPAVLIWLLIGLICPLTVIPLALYIRRRRKKGT